MFHCGLEWPEKDRTNFAKRVHSDGWTGCFSPAQLGNEPWFFYMTKGFVERCLDTIYDIIDGVGAHARPVIGEDDLLIQDDGHTLVIPPSPPSEMR